MNPDEELILITLTTGVFTGVNSQPCEVRDVILRISKIDRVVPVVLQAEFLAKVFGEVVEVRVDAWEEIVEIYLPGNCEVTPVTEYVLIELGPFTLLDVVEFFDSHCVVLQAVQQFVPNVVDLL
ncbi:hypothetical protein ACFR9U_20100 [Halorientalis brevis]|uniref:Uncharacterized protein n=1 Tax=Halorientalis brevis TaxID=1126241 RepID=A0ABD6CG35_9EURY